jgi:hypothetical protein
MPADRAWMARSQGSGDRIFRCGDGSRQLGGWLSGKDRRDAGSRTTDAILGVLGHAYETVPPWPASASSGAPLVDSPEPGSSTRVRGATRPAPARVMARPSPDRWREDELMTLPEAVALFWPNGPLTVTSLRTAGHEGSLEITAVAGKFFVTPAAIRAMGRSVVPKPAPCPPAPTAPFDASSDLLRRIADARGRAGVRRKAASR